VARSGEIVGDRFELLALVGEGGMGSVFRAHDRARDAIVAVKLLRDDRADRARFEREATLLSSLDHPGIVRYVAHGIAHGEAWLAMEWLEGEDLAHALRRGPLAIETAVGVVRRIGEALAVAHAAGIVHRDIKPSNVFLVGGRSDDLRLLDFGIARGGTAREAATRTGTMLGTPGYMAPEQARGERGLDARADVFALGCLLFECVTGEAAFAGENVMAVLARILIDDPDRLRDRRPEVSPALDALCASMLAKEPAARPVDASDVLRRLAGIDDARAPEMIERATPSVLHGERRVLSVLLVRAQSAPVFSDARTEQAEAPETWSWLRDALGTHARVERLVDGTLAAVLFADAATPTDVAARAARQALALRDRFAHAAVSLATGRGEITGRVPVGDAIDRAARAIVSGRCASGVALDELSAQLLEARFEVDRGAHGPILGAERVTAGPALFERRLLGRASPFLGRERELGQLVSQYEECANEPTSRALLITAAAGTGKSRLVSEALSRFARSVPAPDIWSAHGDAMAAGASLRMLADLVRSACAIPAGAPESDARDALNARVARFVPRDRRASVATFLAELIGASHLGARDGSEELRIARADPLILGERVRRAWHELLAAELAAGPRVLVLEDLHWGDLPTVRAISQSVQEHHALPLLVLASARPEIHETFPRLRSARLLDEIKLRPLSPRASERLVRSALGEACTETRVAQIIERSGGNGFYLEELIRAHVEGREGELPESLVAMTQARLERLPTEARRVLRAGSIFGESFGLDGLAALLSDVDREALGRVASQLVEQEVIEAARQGGDQRFSFRHAILREAAYAMLTDADRKVAHGLAGSFLGRCGRDDDAVAIAEHFERAADPAHAVEWYRRAAEQALSTNDIHAALARSERGIACGASGEALGALRFAQADAYQSLSDFRRAAPCSAEALALLPAHASKRAHLVGIAFVQGVWGGFPVGSLEELAREMASIDPVAGAEDSYAMGVGFMGRALAVAGRYAEQRALSTRARTLLPEARGRVEGWLAYGESFTLLYADGDPAAALALYGRAQAACEESYDARGAEMSRTEKGLALIALGAYEEAMAQLEAAIVSADRTGNQFIADWATYMLSFAHIALGRIDEARVTLENAATMWRENIPGLATQARCMRAELAARGGDVVAAEAEIRAALETRIARPYLVEREILLARVCMMAGKADEAARIAGRVVGRLDAIGPSTHWDAEARLALAEAAEAIGQSVLAREAIAVAAAKIRARADRMDERYRASFVGRVPAHRRILELERALVTPA
jgi:tetratricopeptide (TPR) repeat protein